MRKMVKSLFMALLLLAFLVPAAPALADAALDVIVYECLACDKTFYSFMGCDLTNKEYKNEGPQLSNVFRLGPGWRNLEPCKGFKYHIFDKKNTGKVRMSDIAKYLSMFAVEKGRTINGSHTRWKCFMCDKVIYTLNDDDPNIKEWDEQDKYIFNLNGKPIFPPKEPYHGHVFKKLGGGSTNTDRLSQNFDDVYWVKQ